MNTEIPIRTYSITNPEAGFIEISVPIMSPVDSEEYLRTKLADVPLQDRLKLHDKVMEIVTGMWNGYALWVGDPAQARIELRHDEETVNQCRQT